MKLTQLIEAEIERCLVDPNPPLIGLRTFVARYRILPLLVDWNGFFGIQANGDILCVQHDDKPENEEDVELITEDRLRRVALAQGAKKYAWLAELMPPRPGDAVDCSGCGGTGQIQVPGISPGVIVCYCGGLGWLAVEEQALLQRNHDNRANLSPS